MKIMTVEEIVEVMKILSSGYESWNAPIVTYIKNTGGSPFRILISTVLSLRTKDRTTAAASERLFSFADTPERILKMTGGQIEKLIYPVGFYRTKAVRIFEISRILVEKYNSKVPDGIDELLKLPGVGRKTANLVVTLGFGKPGICVDTHVHRISNRFGFVRTGNPEQTEFALRDKLPADLWISYNDILVAFGQTICRPVSPFCSKCPVNSFCRKAGVTKSR